MIPIRDVIPSRSTPWVTVSLIATTVLVAVWSLTRPAPDALLLTWGLVPGAFSWTTATTALFIHSGWIHLAANMLVLWIFGETVEDRMGHARFLILYVAAGLSSGLVAAWASPSAATPIVGAGGAVAGLIGAHLMLFPPSRILVPVPIVFVHWEVVEMPAAWLVAAWLAFQVLGGAAAPMGAPAALLLWTHAGGVAAGAALLLPLLGRHARRHAGWWSR